MPRLLLFAPCRQAIVNKDDASVSLITVLTTFGITAFDPVDDIPRDAVAPINWAAVSVWEREPGDEGRTFEQRIQVFLPDGTQSGEGTLSFELPLRTHIATLNSAAFPVGQTGIYRIVLQVREVGSEEWDFTTDYPIELNRVHGPASHPI